ncbi:MAG TPA: hypothetical protein VGB16_05865 [candidate division Zixibacteria bacterium]
MSEAIGLWIGALLTLGIFSFLYKDNPLYKFCEALFVGISAGYFVVISYWQIIVAKMVDVLRVGFDYWIVLRYFDFQSWLPLLGGVFGILMLLRLFPKIGWISRWSLALVVGTTAGLYFTVYLVSNGMMQVKSTIIPLYVAGDMSTTIGNIVVVLGTVCGLIYFFFSKEHKGVFGGVAKIGIWFIMITFGASFGYTVMSRMSLLIGRMDYLGISFGEFLKLLK